jgi:hypothetical protein
VSKMKPQVIDDEERERVHERVAAIDVAKDSGMVCTRTPHPSRPGARRSTVWTVQARMGQIRQLGRQLAGDGIEIVTLELTSVIWGPNGMNRTSTRSARRGRVCQRSSDEGPRACGVVGAHMAAQGPGNEGASSRRLRGPT